jgi:hypothetical protein
VVDHLARLHRQDGSDNVAAEVLVARVRAVVGHTVSHPTSVAVGMAGSRRVEDRREIGVDDGGAASRISTATPRRSRRARTSL